MKSILSIGELFVDVIPTSPIQLGRPCYTPYPGGAVANVAAAVARLGVVSRFIGTVSGDEFGPLLVQVLAENHVDTRYIRVVKEATTAFALVTLSADGQRHFTFFHEGTADSQLRVEDLACSAWNDAAICHVGGVLLSTEPARSATLAAMRRTHLLGSIVSFDANIRPTLWTSQAAIRETLAKAIEGSDILKLSAEEAVFLAEQTDSLPEFFDSNHLKTLGEALLEKGPHLVIITRGAHGALLLTARHQVEVRSVSVSALDTTGAGDAFMGAVLYVLTQQHCSTPADLRSLSADTLRHLGSFANQVAGLSCTRYGGISSFPYLHEIHERSASWEKSTSLPGSS